MVSSGCFKSAAPESVAVSNLMKVAVTKLCPILQKLTHNDRGKKIKLICLHAMKAYRRSTAPLIRNTGS